MTAVARLKGTREAVERPGEEAFLGVTRSARGLLWSDRLPPGGTRLATAISQRHGLPEMLGRVLAARGFGIDEVPDVLEPTLKALMPDPSTVRDMDAAAERIAKAILAKEPVAVFGDYDVDGACSAALMRRFFLAHGQDTRVYIPDRLFEGYGPNVPAIEGLVADGARLIVTVDCGTTSHAPLAAGRCKGADVVVVDHHQADAVLPEVNALVNPNRLDDVSGLGHLCAAGVTFMLLVATARALRRAGITSGPDLKQWLDLVALATVADVVPLRGLNRAFVTQGLKVMRARQNLGLRALIDAAGLKTAPNTYTLGFVLGPRINAGGRIGDAALGSKLLATSDPVEAQRIAALLERLNRERKAVEQAALEAAMAAAEAKLAAAPDTAMLILADREWHKGIVGLVASRLVERFHRPACVIALDENGTTGTGSLRSVAGIDIGAAIRDAVADGLLLKGGGHAMAAGLTLEAAKLADLEAYANRRLKVAAERALSTADIKLDGVLTPAAVSPAFIDLLERAGPYGQGNPSPRFAFAAHRVRGSKVVGDAHLRVTIEAGDGSRLEAVAFRAVGQPLGDLLTRTAGMPLHIAGQLRRDSWGGRERIVLTIDDAADPRAQK
jgi:single-stranded-DNA-specific exonuclease